MVVALIAIVVLKVADIEVVAENSGTQDAKVEVPDLIGLDRVAAERKVRFAELEPKTEIHVGRNERLGLKEGPVKRQSPPAGTKVTRGAKVQVVLGVP